MEGRPRTAEGLGEMGEDLGMVLEGFSESPGMVLEGFEAWRERVGRLEALEK